MRLALLCLATVACRPVPDTDMLVGRWTNEDGALLILDADGSCLGENLPRRILDLDGSPERVSGSGTWAQEEGTSHPSLRLRFSQLSGFPGGYSIPIHVDRQGEGWVLFWWVGEAGGERYKLTREVSGAGGQ
jgi:hypothetical protein